MKFYVIEIATGDAKIEGKSVYAYDTLNEAKASYHKKLGIAIGSELYQTELVLLVDENGDPILIEKHSKVEVTE